MRTICTLLFVWIVLGIQAQIPIVVKIEQRPSSQGVQPAFEVMVPQATATEAIDLWKETIMPKGLFKKGPKMEKVKDEWLVNNVLISDITSSPLNVITQVSSFTGNIYVRIFLQTETGFLGPVGSSPEAVDAANRYIRNYAVDLYRQAVTKELRQEEKELKELENSLGRLQKQNRSYNKQITEAQRDEKDLKNEALQNEELLRSQQNMITLGNTTESGKEQLEKQVKDTHKDIDKNKKEQYKYSRKVSKNERDQRDKISAIERQKMKVEEVRKKLGGIM
ncbi:MAG TPA: hypothetical protein PLW67_09050 [Prolixibacteraceae bacterium]|nr:hypothetical protein [Prolixibacteraceae bacterium]